MILCAKVAVKCQWEFVIIDRLLYCLESCSGQSHGLPLDYQATSIFVFTNSNLLEHPNLVKRSFTHTVCGQSAANMSVLFDISSIHLPNKLLLPNGWKTVLL